MKKYVFLLVVLIVLGILGGGVWLASSSKDKEETITPQSLSSWVGNQENSIFEVREDAFYVQEAIGSTGIILSYPEELEGNFTLRFQMLSLTQKAAIRFVFGTGKNIYGVEMKISAQKNKLRLLKNKVAVLEKDGPLIKPDIYYSFELSKKGADLSLKVNEAEAINMQISDTPLKFSIELVGYPDNPAAVEIMDMEIIQYV